MTRAQRWVLIAGAICLLHTAMVPPVSQVAGEACRYHEFVVRAVPFTRGYGVAGGDVPALLSEVGLIAAATAIVFLALGLRRS